MARTVAPPASARRHKDNYEAGSGIFGTDVSKVETVYLTYVNPEENSYKFYEVSKDGDTGVVTRWGRIGTAGQSSYADCLGTESRDGKLRTIVRQKLRAGYRIIQIDLTRTPPRFTSIEEAQAWLKERENA